MMMMMMIVAQGKGPSGKQSFKTRMPFDLRHGQIWHGSNFGTVTRLGIFQG